MKFLRVPNLEYLRVGMKIHTLRHLRERIRYVERTKMLIVIQTSLGRFKAPRIEK